MTQRLPLSMRMTMAVALAWLSSPAFGLDKANNTDNVNLSSSWAGGASTPGAFDVARWTNAVTSANTVTLGANVIWGNLLIENPTGLVTINGTSTLTLNAASSGFGIDVRASQNLAFNANLAFNHGTNQVIRVGTGASLAIGGTFTRNAGATVNFQNSGTLTTTSITNTNDIIGPWVTSGTGASTRYATVSGSNIAAYTTGTNAGTAAAITDTSGAVNYELAAGGTLGAGASFNTVRYTGGSDSVAGAFSANGIMHVGSGMLTFSNAVTIGATRELVVNAATSTSDITFSGNIINNGGGASNFTKTGLGTVYTTGTHSYTGTLSISGGVLDVGNVSNLGTGAISLSNGGVLQGFGTLTKAINTSGSAAIGAGQVGGHSGGFAARGGDLIINFGGAAAQFSMNTSGHTFGNDLRFGSTTATHKVTLMNDININSGSQRTVTVIKGTGTDSAELAGVLSNGGVGFSPSGIVKAGDGILILSNTNTYTGITSISGGILSISNIKDGGINSNIGGSSNAVTNLVFSGNSTLQYTGVTASTDRGFTINAGVTGGIEVNSASTTLTVTGNINASTTTGGFTKSGSGTLILQGAKNYTGRTTITGGVFDVGNVSTLGASALLFSGDGILQGNGTLNRTFDDTNSPTTNLIAGELAGQNGGFAAKGGALILNLGSMVMNTSQYVFGANLIFGSATADSKVELTSNINLNASASNRTFTVNSGLGGDYAVLSGVLSENVGGNSGVTKNGTGLLILTGANTYTNTTSVNNGSLFANYTGNAAGASSTGSGNVTIASIGTLGGYGKIGTGAALVTVSGKLNPGDTTLSDTRDTLTINGSLLLNSAAITNLEIASLSDFDKVVVTALATLDGTVNLDFTNFSSALFASSFTLDVFDWATVNSAGFTVGDGVTGDLKLVGTNYGGNTGSWDFSHFTDTGLGGGTITWNATSIPEPSRALLAVAGLALMVFRRRRA